MIFERIATGYKFLEAARADEKGALYFSDYARGGIYCRLPDGATRHWLRDMHAIGGMAFNDDGRFILSSAEGLWLFDPATDVREPLLLEVEGERRSFNDIEPDGAGGLYAGTIDLGARGQGIAPRYGELLHLAADRTLTILRRDVGAANGIGLNADRTILYLSDTGTGVWRHAFLSPDRLGAGDLIHAASDTDGLEVDALGHVWVACWQSGQVVRIGADGGGISRYALPEGQAMTLTFGGDDLRDLYVFGGADVTDADVPATASIYHARVDTPGQAAGRTAFR